MRKNLITAKTQKSTQGQTKMAKPLHGIMNKQSLFRGAAPQGEFTNISKTATTNMAINPAQFYSPELTPETWLLPKSRLEILKWCRIYFNLDPYIQSILTMHAQYPISTFRLQYKDKDTEDFFNRKLFEDCQIDWVSFLERLSLSYYVYGEAICWGDWNSVKGTWNDIILIDPALIDYQEDALTGKSVMSLIPTQELKQLVAQALRDGSTNLPADYIACVQDNKQIPLDTEGVEPNYLTGRKYVPPTAFIFARLLSPGSTRGVPIIQQLFKTLIYADKIRLAQVAAADSFYNPIQLWSIGSYTGDPKTSIIPTEADLQQYRDMIEQATMTPPFSIYVPPFVKYEALGVQGKLLSVYEDLGYVENCIFVGLGVNKNLVLGSGPSFSSGKQISLYRLIKMYKSFRLKLEAFFKKYIILPIAKAADIRDENSNYIIPEIKWSESLQPEQDKDLFDSLFKLYDKGLVSTQTLMEHFMIPLDMKLEQQRMEAEKRTIFDKGTDRLGAKVLREDLQNLDKSKMGGGSTSGPKSEPFSGGSSGGAGGEEKLDLGKPYPGSAGSDKSSLPPPISGGAGLDKGEPTSGNETPTPPAEPPVQ